MDPHFGVVCATVLYILGGEVFRLIPALSLLKDGKMYGQLQSSFYNNVRACFEAKEGAAGMNLQTTVYT